MRRGTLRQVALTALPWLVLGLPTLFLAVALVRAATDARATVAEGRFNALDACQWRWGVPPISALEAFLASVDDAIPHGARVVFAGPGPDEGVAAACRRAWAAYLAPRVRVVAPRDGGSADHWLAYRTPSRPGAGTWRRVVETTDGTLDRRAP